MPILAMFDIRLARDRRTSSCCYQSNRRGLSATAKNAHPPHHRRGRRVISCPCDASKPFDGRNKTMATLTLQDLGGLSLRHGDHDANRIWGGSARPTEAGSPVTELQTALIRLGTLTVPADGAFGPQTEQ